MLTYAHTGGEHARSGEELVPIDASQSAVSSIRHHTSAYVVGRETERHTEKQRETERQRDRETERERERERGGKMWNLSQLFPV